ncbi:hypothetical protein M3B43_10175 [Nesterenkonia massiliensis]|uniref:Secreted protein n=1 Tax=Nesterenkonia massiliensis TaxID=1232429 RepID=A0ABT2HSP3_9MICC|nr:hypothetical protein [Nesterenkonia massiliensis]MCT1607676.1 hypothetical protein [Nesterenkonia massiliensis]
MKLPEFSTAFSRPKLLAALTAGVALLLLVVVGIYGLAAGPRQPESPAPTTAHTADPTPSPPGEGTEEPDSDVRQPVVPPVERSADPETFARNVATALFEWDTASGLMPLDYTSALLDVGDPTGAEQAGLASDVATYLPTREAWTQLRQHSTSQHLSIDEVYVPRPWEDALAQAQPGQITEGTVAYTITGTRHRDGTWNDEPVTSEHEVSFTVFIVCAPAYETCHLLRLSELDNPLT